MRRKAVIVLPIAILAVLAGGVVVLVAVRGSHSESNERAASAALKTLATAEADYRSNDRDGNEINDYWTGDVAGLYRNQLRLIPRESAEADARPLNPLVPKPVPH